jgi:DNA-directed RNA polymerase specialized sigma24 family protein
MSKNTVNKSLTVNRRRDVVENDEYHAFATRIVRAYSRRVATGDIEALAAMVSLGNEVETATRQAVIGLRDYGYSWAEIAARLGVTKQAAQQRWGGDRP